MSERSRCRLFVLARLAATFLVFAAIMSLSSCALFRIAKDPKKDYVFSVTGVVTMQDSTPLVGADVTLDVNGPVYEVIDPVRSRHVVTNESGGFIFAYISQQWGVQYAITVRKEGFQPETVSGAAPPNASLTIKLRKAGDPIKSDAVGPPVSSHYPLPTIHYSLVGVSR